LKKSDLQGLIADRLEHLATQVDTLHRGGDFAEAELLRDEGLLLAQAYDNEETFLFIGGLTEV
jgi:hypothetical protein